MTWAEWGGWLGNACFFGRFLLQWLHVERLRERSAPRLFWVLSLSGSVLLSLYAANRGVWVLLVGFAVNGAIYARNLRLGGASVESRLPRRTAIGFAVTSATALVAAGVVSGTRGPGESWEWLALVVTGQALWSSRFVVQWWYSERSGESHFPPAFWALSLTGNALLLAYAIHLVDPVFIAGLALGPIVQIRNLFLTGGASGSEAPSRPT